MIDQMPGDDQMMEEQEVEETGAAGICIEVHCKPDGSFEVVTEPLEGDEEMAESGEPAASAGEAFKMAFKAYTDWVGSSGSEDDQMASGFKSVRPGPAGV